MPNKQQVIAYLQNQIAQGDFYAGAYIYDDKGQKNPQRNAFVKIRKYIKDFLNGNSEIRWVIIPGIRGVGKTTLLSQIYAETNLPNEHKLLLSVDQATQIEQTSLDVVLEAYEEILGSVYERLKSPVILFLDEIHYDPKWGQILKTIYDRTRKVFILVTGSSALSLHTNADVVRRAIFEPLYPMSFTEYIKIKQNKFEIKGLSEDIRKILFYSSSAEQVFNNLHNLEPKIIQYWTGIDRLEMEKYLKYGTLPFAVKIDNEGLIYDQIKKILERVIYTDIPQLGNLKQESISHIPAIMYAIAGADTMSLRNYSSKFSISFDTLTEIMNILEKSGILHRIYPYGASFKQVKKPSKYLFVSPAFRSMYFNFIGHINQDDIEKGRLVEDLVGMYLYRYLQGKVNVSLTYDSAEGGADFILEFGSDKIIIEVGYGHKGFKQIYSTSKKIKSKYGLNISGNNLGINEQKTAVSVPLSWFILV